MFIFYTFSYYSCLINLSLPNPGHYYNIQKKKCQVSKILLSWFRLVYLIGTFYWTFFSHRYTFRKPPMHTHHTYITTMYASVLPKYCIRFIRGNLFFSSTLCKSVISQRPRSLKIIIP